MWNVRALVENSGDARICRTRPKTTCNCNSVDRKLDLLIGELKRYKVSAMVAAIQETKWFGQDVWNAEGYTFLHSGRPLPTSEDDHAMRNEGVGIALDERATIAWRAAMETWCAVSSRIVTARLNAVSKGQRRPASSREPSDVFMTILSVYAPTSKAPPSIKQKFSQDLQATLSLVLPRDILVLLGDFNARVGKRDHSSCLCEETLVLYGLDERNDAGEDFLECVLPTISPS